jgi:hypothetical protein
MARDDSEDADADRAGTMRARTWTIAANFRTPADYDVPTAPSLPAKRRADGTLVLVDPDDSTPVMTVGEPVSVRR